MIYFGVACFHVVVRAESSACSLSLTLKLRCSLKETPRHLTAPAAQPGRRAIVLTALLSVAAVLPRSSQNQNHAARAAPADQPPVPASEQLVLPLPSGPPVLSEQP